MQKAKVASKIATSARLSKFAKSFPAQKFYFCAGNIGGLAQPCSFP